MCVWAYKNVPTYIMFMHSWKMILVMAVSLVYIHKKQQQPLAKNNPKFFSQITSIKLRTFDAKSWAGKFWLRILGSGILGCRL